MVPKNKAPQSQSSSKPFETHSHVANTRAPKMVPKSKAPQSQSTHGFPTLNSTFASDQSSYHREGSGGARSSTFARQTAFVDDRQFNRKEAQNPESHSNPAPAATHFVDQSTFTRRMTSGSFMRSSDDHLDDKSTQLQEQGHRLTKPPHGATLTSIENDRMNTLATDFSKVSLRDATNTFNRSSVRKSKPSVSKTHKRRQLGKDSLMILASEQNDRPSYNKELNHFSGALENPRPLSLPDDETTEKSFAASANVKRKIDTKNRSFKKPNKRRFKQMREAYMSGKQFVSGGKMDASTFEKCYAKQEHNAPAYAEIDEKLQEMYLKWNYNRGAKMIKCSAGARGYELGQGLGGRQQGRMAPIIPYVRH